jgi:hypothetical protein
MKTIKLTQGFETVVSDEDYEEISKYRWRVSKRKNTNYATRSDYKNCGKQKNILMHKQIMDTPDGMHTDHIDGNGLNNTRDNLRVVTPRQNGQNRHCKKTSIYPGVSWHKSKNNWTAQININGKFRHLCESVNESKAYQAYLNALHEINETIVSDL